MAELTDQEILERAQHAKRILDDDLFKETILAIEENIIAEWRSTEPLGYEKREAAYAKIRSLNAIVSQIRNVMDTGDFLKDQLEKQKRHEQ